MTIDTSTVDHFINALTEPPEPAAEVITLDRQMAERILGWLEDHPKIAGVALSTCEEISTLRQALAEPKVELWAIHSVGPGEIYPSLSREHAERQAKELFECGQKMKADRIARGESVEHWHDWVTNVIPSPWVPAEHFEILAQETAEHRDDMRARLEELEGKAEYSDPRNGAETWSANAEDWHNYGSVDELIRETASDVITFSAGDIVYVGTKKYSDPASFLDHQHVLEHMGEMAGDSDAGEWADGYPQAGEAAEAELDILLSNWARRHCTPEFYLVENVRTYTLTAEDIANAAQEGDA
ncbi:hypothetical protein D9M70_361680 [compost metagenome]